jgi:mannose-6-phosphate isomerase-like protein (cupin superfamily)
MKIQMVVTALLFSAFAVEAADPPGFQHWTSAELKGFAKSLAPKIDQNKVATQQLGKFGNYSFMAAHREGPGEAEYHETQADIFIVESGEATLVIGGKLVNGKTTAPNEMRAPSISGGSDKKLGPGDVVSIPAKTPHQVKLDAGKQFTYFIVKVNQ